MFTREDLEALVPSKIFERGVAYYYEDDAVGHIQRKGNVFKARVRGTDTYRVSLTIGATTSPESSCDCAYEHGDVCKHGIALGLAVLDLMDDEPASEPLASSKLSKAEQSVHILNGAWTRTSDKEKLGFLQQLLSQKPKQLRRFLEAFEFDEELLAALPAAPRLTAKSKPQTVGRPVPRQPLTLTEQAHQLLAQQRGRDLLQLVLSVDWLQHPPASDTHTLPYLLSEAARFQPEATLDAVMERFEAFLENKALRAYPLYNRLAACLQALALLPSLTKQVQLFASELMQQYRQLRALRESLARAGFFSIPPEEATALPPKRRGRQPKAVG
jgi:uncharacterized Zn finger protein